tara:strand:+ start:129 stop:764 length:636 start_codon:yes stop_codon:yes gene_type:complete
MKLILENWNRYLIEEEIENSIQYKNFESEDCLKAFLNEEYQKRGVYLTEEQLNEKLKEFIPRWAKKLGKAGAGVALASTMMGAASAGTPDYAAMAAQSRAARSQLEKQVDISGQHQAIQQGDTETGKVVDNGDGTFSLTLLVSDLVPAQQIETLKGLGHLDSMLKAGAQVELGKAVGGTDIKGTKLSYLNAQGDKVGSGAAHYVIITASVS